jgi:diguanylate cyclase (GGDEF)-like protein
MGLHAATLALAAIVAAALQAVAMFYIWFAQFRDRAVVELGIGSAVTALGVALAFSRPHLNPLMTHVVANMLITGGQAYIAFAVGRFVGKRVPPLLVLAVPVAVGAAIAYYLYVETRLDVRIAAYSLGVAVASGVTAALLLVGIPRGPLRLTHWPVGLLYLLQALLAIMRTVWVMTDNPGQELFENDRLQVMWFSQAIIFVNLTFLGLTLMITQRPRLDLDRQVNYDLLTGALNRPGFDRAAEAEWSRTIRHDLALSLLILDLDRFKALNSTLGSDASDAWLKAFATMVLGLLRREDLLCRFRSEEFLILLPQTPFEAALQAAERIRRATEGLRLNHGRAEVRTTVSVGVAARTADRLDLKSIIAAADRALHRAKAAGRNRVEADEGR